LQQQKEIERLTNEISKKVYSFTGKLSYCSLSVPLLLKKYMRSNGEAWHRSKFYLYTVLYVDSASNDLYVGGWFTNAGGVFASKIARWDGNNWYDLEYRE
jgi:hypothetical protein